MTVLRPDDRTTGRAGERVSGVEPAYALSARGSANQVRSSLEADVGFRVDVRLQAEQAAGLHFIDYVVHGWTPGTRSTYH